MQDTPKPDQPDNSRIQGNSFRMRIHRLLFVTHTGSGRVINHLILASIILAVTASMFNTIDAIHQTWGYWIVKLEFWLLVGFAFEYAARIYSASNRWHYIRSFNGIVDLATILPLFITGNSFVLIRLLRLIRVIRVAISFPVVRALFASLKGSASLLMGVLGSIVLISVMIGNIVYIVEPQTFPNAFEGIWWSLVTMSTVGYGDLVPHTALGKVIGAGLIMSGICMFAMITAVISVRVGRMANNMGTCCSCNHGISEDLPFCPHCGVKQQPINSMVSDNPNIRH